MTEKLKLSYTKTSTFLRCRKMYEWKYVEGLYATGKSWPLKLGDIVHQLLHGHDKEELTLEQIQDYNKVIKIVKDSYPDEEEDTLLDLTSQASTLCAGYLDEHKDANLKVIPGETMLEHDMGDYILLGIVDGWARPPDDKLFRLERKTAGRMDNAYLQGLKGGLQGAIYDMLTESLFQEHLSGTIYDIIVKTKVPQFARTFAKCDRTSIDLAKQTLAGVYRDIQKGDFYPSTDCFKYNSECPYRKLCAFDSPSVRESFFTRREEVKQTKKTASDKAVNEQATTTN